MAAAVDVREPLLPLYPHNCHISRSSQELARLSPGLGKLSQRPKIIRKSASIGSSKAHFTGKGEPINQSPPVENLAARGSSGPSSSPKFIAEDSKSAMEMSQAQSRSLDKHGECDMPAISTGNDRDGGAMVQHDDQEKVVATAEDEQESRSILQLKMEAMTWAALAKDDAISSLERRLRQALEIAKAEQERNIELGRLLRESQEREVAIALKLQDAQEQIGQLIEAEERLCVQLGDLEAEAVEEDRRYRSQITTLTARIEAQDQFIAEALKSFKESGVQQSDSRSNAHMGYHVLAEKLEKAEMDIAALRTDLSDAHTELRVSEGIKKRQGRRLKALEKERRYLTRKGPVRSVRLAPPAQKKCEAEGPGGGGWKVFSILDFEA